MLPDDQTGGRVQIMTVCDVDIRPNYQGIVGIKDRFECVICGKDVDHVYYCPCSESCCIRLCIHCRDKRYHMHSMLAHYMIQTRDKREVIKHKERPKCNNCGCDLDAHDGQWDYSGCFGPCGGKCDASAWQILKQIEESKK